MSELKPGTPEYQAEYDKEMKRLEAEAGANTDKKVDKPDTTTSKADDKADEKTAEKKADDAKTETAAELTARVEKAEKALKDTQRWGHENAARVKRLEKEAEDRKHAAKRPEILDANPQLEEAIKHVAGTKADEKPPQEQWFESVTVAIPDVNTLLGDKDFYAQAAAKKAELGSEWDNPLIAIRELSAMRTEHLSKQNVQAAVEAARKDFEVKSKKRTAMEVPGGSGGKDASTTTSKEDEEVKRFRTMSTADLNKERSRVLGY